MRTRLALFLLASCLAAQAHIGSPNVFLEDKAGEYPVRVVIRPPQVVPGLAEITVRVPEPVQRVTVLPVFSRTGRGGSPPPDEAKLVRGETNLYSAALWLMKSGAYSVEVMIEGPRGKGTLVVPVNSMATNTQPMARGYGLMLAFLGTILFAAGLKIASAVFSESRLDPGVIPSRRNRWHGRAAMLLAAGIFSLALWGGKKWWDFEDRNYRNNSLFKPVPVSAQVRTDHDQLILAIKVEASERRGRWTPLIADHGKLIHLFLVRDGTQGAFAHLHPVLRGAAEFEVPLPPLPTGNYFIYADVTHEDGFSETLVANTEIPAASLEMKRLWLGNSAEAICSAAVSQMLAQKLFFPPDPDDSWRMEIGATASSQNSPSPVADAGGGYKIIWENSGVPGKSFDGSLRFKLLAPDNQLARIEPYMGMLGHAVVRRTDGKVFAHIHPVGTFSMAAQQFFTEGKPAEKIKELASAGLASTPEVHSSHTNGGGALGEISFPYAFPEPGPYRFWV
ncbi:MAG: hypothetical protein ABIQ35_10500, partial [Verrucomicrobiota bacterium]